MAKRRNGAIDFWRFIFSMALVIFHAYLLDPKNASSPVFLLNRGSMGVEFFFLTSGYLLAASVNRIPDNAVFNWRDTWTFVKHKVKSFYPAYVLTWALGFIFINIVRVDDIIKLTKHFFSAILELFLIRNAGFDGYRVMNQAWYLSVMTLAIFIIYPIYAKNKKRFEYYIAPAVSLTLLGYLRFKTETLNDPNLFMTLSFKSTYRGLAEICLGIVCYVICQKIREKAFSRWKAHLLTVIELGGYASVIYYMQFHYHFPPYFQFLTLFVLAICVTITFSEKSSVSPLFQNRFCNWLGKYSLYPFLTFIWFTKTLPRLFPDMGIIKLELLYFGLSLLSGLLVMLIQEPVMKGVRALGRLMIKKEDAPKVADPAS